MGSASDKNPSPKNGLAKVEGIILSRHVAGLRRVDPRKVPTAEWVRIKCQFGCGGYGQCLTCPPYAPTPEQTRRLLDSYTIGYLIHWGHKAGKRQALADIEREIFLAGWHKAFAMATGPCELCRECNVEEGCTHPSLARPSMEACGIDVFQTARDAGFPIRVVTSHKDKPNFFSLLLVE
jgi:predicted metal-binding protein